MLKKISDILNSFKKTNKKEDAFVCKTKDFTCKYKTSTDNGYFLLDKVIKNKNTIRYVLIHVPSNIKITCATDVFNLLFERITEDLTCE